jgi:Na+-transporting methylmalonyl-CoA/oxaloacetate decarboxylase gamma subunit
LKYSTFLYKKQITYNLKKGVKNMSFSQSILVALFCIAVVFVVLGVLWAIIRIFSLIINFIENNHEQKAKN